MSGFERPVLKLKGMQHSSSESSLHLKVDESPQSSVSEERKITSEPYQYNGSRQRESNKEESKQKWSRTSKEDDKEHQVITLQAGVAVLDDDLIEESRAQPWDYGSNGIQMESNFIQDTDCGFFKWISGVRDEVDDLRFQLLEKETTIAELEMQKVKMAQLIKKNLEDVQELKAEVTQMRIKLMKSVRNERNFSLALVLSWVLFGTLVMCLK